MKQRTIFRWIHIILSIPIVGYIYSPFDKLPQFANYVRLGYAPMIILTGLWMWKGHVVRRLISKRLGKQSVADQAASTELISQHQ
jgi:hypothetical protein